MKVIETTPAFPRSTPAVRQKDQRNVYHVLKQRARSLWEKHQLLHEYCTLNVSFKKYQDSPGLQAGDDEAELLLPSPLRRLQDGGEGRGVRVFFHPRLESRGYSRSCKIF